MRLEASGSPLSHVIPHPLHQQDYDLGMLTPEGVITVLSDQIVMMILACLLLCIVFPLLMRKRRDASETGRLVTAGFAAFFAVADNDPSLARKAARYMATRAWHRRATEDSTLCLAGVRRAHRFHHSSSCWSPWPSNRIPWPMLTCLPLAARAHAAQAACCFASRWGVMQAAA